MACLADATIQGLLEHTLPAGEDAEARAHLAHCDDCRAIVAALAREGSSFGRYAIVSPLGAGAIGIVYRAHDRELARDVALKVLRTDAGDLTHEAQAMAKLQHANVVSVYDVGRVGEQTFIAMELVAGGTLSAWLASRKRAPAAIWRTIVELFVQAGRGLAAAHRAGIVHGDFKPDNVLIGRDGAPRVGDFGLAGERPRGGTPAYMAPEQLANKHADARADQFGWCVALYEAIENRRPFEGDSRESLARAVGSGPRPWRARLPRKLRAAISRGLSADPAARYPSMDALLADVTGALEPVRVWPAIALAALAAGTTAVVLAATRTQAPADPFAPDPAIAGDYADAMAALRDRQPQRARQLLEGALATAPHDALARSALASMLATVCRDAAARSEATQALGDRAAIAAPTGRLLVEGRAYTALHDWPKAVIAYTALAGTNPGDVSLALELANAQEHAGASKDALATLAKLPQDDPLVGLSQGMAYSDLGDVTAQHATAKRVADAARTRGDRAVLARALQIQALADANRGDLAAAASASEEAIGLFDAVGDPIGKLQAMDTAATAHAMRGESDTAGALYEQEVAGAHETGCEEQSANALNNLAVLRYERGDLAGARAIYEQALPGFHAAGNKPGEANTLINMAAIALQTGDLETARTQSERALALARESNDQAHVAGAQGSLAWALRDLGELDEAKRALAETIRIAKASGDRQLLADTLIEAFELDYAAGDDATARKDLDDCLAIARPAGFAETERNADLALATMTREDRPADAIAKLTALVDALHASRSTVQEASALVELGRAYDAIGKPSEANEALARAAAIHTDNADVRFELALLAAKRDEHALAGLADDAAKQRWFEHGWRARLALAQLHADAAAIRSLADEARSRGYLHLAQKL